MTKMLGAFLLGLILTLFAAPAANAFASERPSSARQDGDGKGKQGKKHGKKKHQGKKKHHRK